MTVAEIWERTQQFNSEMFQSMKDGATWEEAEKEYNAKIAALVTPEEYTVSELAKCDIYVDAAQIIYSVKSAFPAISGKQIAKWICSNAEEHHEITVPNKWANADGTINWPE